MSAENWRKMLAGIAKKKKKIRGGFCTVTGNSKHYLIPGVHNSLLEHFSFFLIGL